jgi:lysophospholipase L1-like esterase
MEFLFQQKSNMKKIILTIIALLPLISCGQDNSEEPKEMMTKKEMKFLALGDSYTIGESVTVAERWPVLLANDLNQLNYEVSSPEIIAKTGWTTDELIDALEKQQVATNFDLVSLSIGVNNQYRGRDLEEFRTQFIELLGIAIRYANGDLKNVFVVSIPDWSVVPFAEDRDQQKISQEIEQFNAIKKEETLKRKITFVDITPISRMAKGNAEYVASDGLHFSGKMHQLWVDEIIKTKF